MIFTAREQANREEADQAAGLVAGAELSEGQWNAGKRQRDAAVPPSSEPSAGRVGVIAGEVREAGIEGEYQSSCTELKATIIHRFTGQERLIYVVLLTETIDVQVPNKAQATKFRCTSNQSSPEHRAQVSPNQ
jgi:hypothetical protein